MRISDWSSDVCSSDLTAQVLLAVMAGFYAVYHGPERLRIIAERTHRLTAILGAGLRRLGFKVANRDFFDPLPVELDGGEAAIHRRARKPGINLRDMGRKTNGIAPDDTKLGRARCRERGCQ